MNVTPRPYQSIAVKAAVKGLTGRAKRALVVLATGLGKTLTAAFIAKQLKAKRVLFLVHNNFILKHAVDEFAMVYDQRTKMATFNGMSKTGAEQADIVFATWQTMGRNLKRWRRDHFDLIIVDEAHHTEADTYRPVVNYFTGAKLGITATPDRVDKADIRDVFGKEVANVTLEEAIARDWLPRIEYHVVTDESLDVDTLQDIMAEIRQGKKRFTMAEVNRRIFIRKRDKEIARIINGYNEKAVVFCASINHAERMNKSLNLSTVFHSKAGSDQSDTWKKNQATLDHLKNGIIRRVCAVNAFNEGVNVPSVGLVAFCRVTGALTIFRQQLGRGLRPGKDKLIVLDFVGNLERIQLVLEMMNKISDEHECFTTDEERTREGYERQRFEVSGAGFEFTFSDRVVDLMKVLEHVERDFYPTWQEASRVAIKLNLNNQLVYRAGYKLDPQLPSEPHRYYVDYPGDLEFFGRTYYQTWQEASAATAALGVTAQKQYRDGLYKRDPRLHSNPNSFYGDWPGWLVFLGGYAKNFYPTCEEALAAISRMGISSYPEYGKRYREDPRLPSNPYYQYPNFPGFDGSSSRKLIYKTWQEAGKAAVGLGITTSGEFRTRYKADPLLPSRPDDSYSDFPGWRLFLGGQERVNYKTWQEASIGALNLGIKGKVDYQSRYKENSHLPGNPRTTYKDFPGWAKFLGKKK